VDWQDDSTSHDDLFVDDTIRFVKGHPAIVNVGALDVLHSFYLPHFRIKMDCVPGTPNQIKFVINSPSDLDEAVSWLHDLDIHPHSKEARHVYLMPQGVTQSRLKKEAVWLEAACKRLGFQLCQRHHIAWFGNTRGT